MEVWKLKRYLVPALLVVIATLAAAWYNTNSKLTAAQLRSDEARKQLVMYHNASPLSEMFRSVRQTPTPEGLKALAVELTERKAKIEALIELHRHEILKPGWANYTARPPEQATILIFNLATQNKVSDEDWKTYDQVAKVWLAYEAIMQSEITGTEIPNPSGFADNYVRLITELSTIAKAP